MERGGNDGNLLHCGLMTSHAYALDKMQAHNQAYMPIRRLACSMFSVSELLAVWLAHSSQPGHATAL